MVQDVGEWLAIDDSGGNGTDDAGADYFGGNILRDP